jgi:hypothetical protein
MKQRIRAAAWASLVIVGVCAWSAAALLWDVWTYRDKPNQED